MDMALAVLNYSRIYHIYDIYSGINRGVNKKEGDILCQRQAYARGDYVIASSWRVNFELGGERVPHWFLYTAALIFIYKMGYITW